MLKVIIFLIFVVLFVTSVLLNVKEIFKFFLTYKKTIFTVVLGLVIALSLILTF